MKKSIITGIITCMLSTSAIASSIEHYGSWDLKTSSDPFDNSTSIVLSQSTKATVIEFSCTGVVDGYRLVLDGPTPWRMDLAAQVNPNPVILMLFSTPIKAGQKALSTWSSTGDHIISEGVETDALIGYLSLPDHNYELRARQYGINGIQTNFKIDTSGFVSGLEALKKGCLNAW